MKKRALVAMCVAMLGQSAGYAADAVTSLPNHVVATVNGVEIDETLFNQILKANVSANRPDNYELRSSIKEELINRELLMQEAQRLGLDKTAQGKVALEQARANALVELLWLNLENSNPIKDNDIQEDYNRQVKALGSGEGMQQYHLSIIALADELEANRILAKLKKGESFQELAKAYSIDPTKAQGGDVGWVLPSQISPLISNVMINLAKGVLPNAPIKMSDRLYQIIRVEDKRAYKVPSLEESKENVRLGLIQTRRQELLKKLKATATVNQ